jgi:CHASE2 domain-containing sensor protein
MAEPIGSSGDKRSFAEVLAQIKRKDAKPHTTKIAWLLPPRDGSETFYEVEANDLLGSPEDAEPVLAGLKDKIVLIGSDLVDIDRHLTPLSVVDESRMPGVKIHA